MNYNRALEFFVENGISLNSDQIEALKEFTSYDIVNESIMTAMAKKAMKEQKKVNGTIVKNFIERFYTPVEGSEKTLKEIPGKGSKKDALDFYELVYISMDDKNFRKKYGVSDEDYLKWLNYTNKLIAMKNA